MYYKIIAAVLLFPWSLLFLALVGYLSNRQKKALCPAMAKVRELSSR